MTSTGPRTSQGKATSKLNATTHGIFSSVVVLKGESQQEYDALLSGLQEACQPVGALENILVDKMATILWRHKRLILAEVGEIGQNWLPSDLFKLPKIGRVQARHQIPYYTSSDNRPKGILTISSDTSTLAACVLGLKDLRNHLREQGFDEEWDRLQLHRIYAAGWADLSTLPADYEHWLHSSKAGTAEPETDVNNRARVKECQAHAVEAVEQEIDRFQKIIDKRDALEPERQKLAKLQGNIPAVEVMDRILRYEASLERAFDRALTQLERLQRMRLGQPIAPPLKLDVNH